MDLKADIKNRNTVWHHATVNRERRQLQNQHKSVVLWFTGLSGAGKSTLAHAIEEELYQKQCRTYVPDGDNVRHGLCSDLGFSDKDREENIRKIGNVAKLFLDSGVIVLTAFISPFQKNRAIVRSLMQASDFLEIYCSVSIDVCEQRDIKGLYKKAREGLIPNFTGVSSKYEAPTTSTELNLNTGEQSLEEYTQSVVQLLTNRGIINNYSN